MTRTFADRLWAKVAVAGPHDCWPWLAWRDEKGYGRLRFARKWVRAHQAALATCEARPGPTFGALHHCDHPWCCNPLHLYWGTHAENNADRSRRRRNNAVLRTGSRHGSQTHPESTCHGSRNWSAKLTEGDVIRIRTEGMPPREVERVFGVSEGNARKVCSGRSWKHVVIGGAS